MIDFTLAELLTGLDLSDEAIMSNPVQRIKELMKSVDFFGSMHIIVEDGNVQDLDLDFVEGLMATRPAIPEEVELLKFLRPLSPKDRYEAMSNDSGVARSETDRAEKPER